jgi:Mce-associated membrane protein
MLIQSERRGDTETVAADAPGAPGDQASPQDEHVEATTQASPQAVPQAVLTSPHAVPPRLRDLRSMQWLADHLPVVLVAMLVLALASGLGYTTLRLRHQDAVNHARTTAMAAAQVYAIELASYDYQHLDEDFGNVKQHSTAAFQAKFAQSSNGLVKLLKDYHATATAKLVAAGLVSADTGRAVVVAMLTQTVTNSAQKGKAPDTQSRIRITMVNHNGQWLIDSVDLL